jgi:hypothetical protein
MAQSSGKLGTRSSTERSGTTQRALSPTTKADPFPIPSEPAKSNRSVSATAILALPLPPLDA